MKTTVKLDEINSIVAESFDYKFDGTIETEINYPPSDFDYKSHGIGLIVGPSGCGKTTILRSLGYTGEAFDWEPNKSICSHFDSVEDAQERLGAVGLNTIPTWMKPFSVLSNGESFRANLAICIKDNAIIDEFTSVVDRNVAKACSKSLRKYVDRKGTTGIVLASCHYDIIEWLQPDWIFDASTGEIEIRGLERRFPQIELQIIPCSWKEWATFKDHHYLSEDINKSSYCWIAKWNDVVVGFASTLAFPNGAFKNGWRGHRTVILPDFQGLGIGVRLSDAIAQIMVSEGKRYFSKTSHVRMGEYRERHPNWNATSKNKKSRHDYKSSRKDYNNMNKLKLAHTDRVCYSHEYVDESLVPIHEERKFTLDFLL